MRRFPALVVIPIALLALVAPSAHASDPLRAKGIIVDGAAPALPQVWAKTWIIVDAATGNVLAAKRAHKKRAPASTIKMLTALTVLPKLPPESTYVARKKAVNMYGSRVGLVRGKTYSIKDLMNAMMLPSANDAAVALAQANGGVRRTVAQMNELAAQLNATNTVARNPSGLDSPGMVSTAYDLAIIARAGLDQPRFSDYVKRVRAEFPIKGKNKVKMIYTTNRLLLKNYRGAIGVKTGFTSNAGRTFVGAAERNGRTLIVAMMGVNEQSDIAAKKLLDWGFKNAGQVAPVGTLLNPRDQLTPDDQPIAEGGGEIARPTIELPTLEGESTVVEVPTTSLSIGWILLAVVLFLTGLLIVLRRRAVVRARHIAR